MAKDIATNAQQGFESLLYQLLETELGGVQVYETALSCVVRRDLKEEWQQYLSQTKRHVSIARELLEKLDLDPDAEVPARMPVRLIGAALVKAMETARKSAKPEEAQLTAAECVVEAETKDHMNWELLGAFAKELKGKVKSTILEAHGEVKKEEDHHLYHTKGWARELWLEALGLPPVLPPPEEKKDVETAIGAERAKRAREQFL